MKKRSAFTLVELVVVIMILGILAAVAAPRLLSTSANATDNGLKQSLTVIRDAIELYAAQNAGKLPGQAGSGTALQTDLKPYLRGNFPVCPVGTKDANVTYTTGTGITADASPTTSWKYSTDTGEFIVNSPAATATDPAVRYDQL